MSSFTKILRVQRVIAPKVTTIDDYNPDKEKEEIKYSTKKISKSSSSSLSTNSSSSSVVSSSSSTSSSSTLQKECSICTHEISDCIAYNICKNNHTVCFDCILKLSRTRKYLCCFCGSIFSFLRLNIQNEDIVQIAFRKYMNFYYEKFESSKVYIDGSGKKISLFTLEGIRNSIDFINEGIQTKLHKKVMEVNKILPNYFPIVPYPDFGINVTLNRVFKCPVDLCEGIVDNNKCGTCNIDVCHKCRCVSHQGDCDKDVLESLYFMRWNKDYSQCPYCFINIKREQGCNNVQCSCGKGFNIVDAKIGIPGWKVELRNIQNTTGKHPYKPYHNKQIHNFRDYMTYFIANVEYMSNHPFYSQPLSKKISEYIIMNNLE